jgi:polyhydroxyalkanoate synthase
MSGVNPFDPFGIGKATLDVWQAMLKEPQRLAETQARFAQMWVDMWTRSAEQALGAKTEPVVTPPPGDRRFAHPAWSQNPALDTLKQAYLIVTEAFLAAIDATDADPQTKRRAKFFAKQFCDMMSPSNIAFLNPDVIEETLRTGGENLVKGWQHAAEDLATNEGRVALVDTSAFEVGKNVGTTPGSVVYRNELMELIRYAPATETVYESPLVIVPPWINKYYILDLQPKNSFVRHAVEAGFHTFVISWRNPDASLADVTMRDYLIEGALEAARVAGEISRTKVVTMNGYCIGGTLLAMLLAYLAAKPASSGDPVVRAATFMASLVDFKEPGEIANFLGEDALEYIEGKMNERGYLEGREMADTFNMLRSNDLIWTPAVNRYLLGKEAPAFDLLYWNNDATRMPAAMHSYYLRHMYLQNDLIKPDALEVDGVGIDVRRITIPLYIVATREDHIAPWRSVYALTQLASGSSTFRLANSGHIAGIVNPPSSKKAQYWASNLTPPDPEEWLAHAILREGSWWPDWYLWLGRSSGAQIPPRENPAFPALAPAPGDYVLAK